MSLRPPWMSYCFVKRTPRNKSQWLPWENCVKITILVSLICIGLSFQYCIPCRWIGIYGRVQITFYSAVPKFVLNILNNISKFWILHWKVQRHISSLVFFTKVPKYSAKVVSYWMQFPNLLCFKKIADKLTIYWLDDKRKNAFHLSNVLQLARFWRV